MNALSINIPANFIASCECTLQRYNAAKTDAERRAVLDRQTVQGLWWAIGFVSKIPLFSISVSRGYCPGSTINTFNHLPHPFSGLIIVQHLYFHCYNHGSRTFPFVGTSYQCQKAFFCLWLIPGSRQHSTSKSKVILIVCKPGSVKRNPRQIRCQNRYNTVFLNAILRFE